jgi:hypothetical protein
VDGRVVKPFGDVPQGYAVYTPDGHVLIQFATRAKRNWPGPEVFQLPPAQRLAAQGFNAYCGTYDVRSGELIHYPEFGFSPENRRSGRTEVRSVELEGDRLKLKAPSGAQVEWRRVHSEGEPQ